MSKHKENSEKIKVIFIKPDGSKVEVFGNEGDSILEIAHAPENADKLYLEGACEGALACSTCHVIVEDDWFNKLDEATNDEEDMLDLAWDLQSNSRLGCQIRLTRELDGIVLRLPSGSRNIK